jgi:hypothetical protein
MRRRHRQSERFWRRRCRGGQSDRLHLRTRRDLPVTMRSRRAAKINWKQPRQIRAKPHNEPVLRGYPRDRSAHLRCWFLIGVWAPPSVGRCMAATDRAVSNSRPNPGRHSHFKLNLRFMHSFAKRRDSAPARAPWFSSRMEKRLQNGRIE